MGHRDYPYNATSCPGNNVHENLPWFRNEIQRYLNLGGPPLEFSISSNSPNPFNKNTKIEYQVPSKNHIRIIIYDILGREVKTLMDQIHSKGDYEVVWNGVSNLGETMGAGI